MAHTRRTEFGRQHFFYTYLIIVHCILYSIDPALPRPSDCPSSSSQLSTLVNDSHRHQFSRSQSQNRKLTPAINHHHQLCRICLSTNSESNPTPPPSPPPPPSQRQVRASILSPSLRQGPIFINRLTDLLHNLLPSPLSSECWACTCTWTWD